MPNTSPKVDAYIAAAAPFARPILDRIRRAFHKGFPEIIETIKWGCPHFEHRGLVGGMAAFKAHAAFESFPPSHRREYVEWIAEAKRAETRRGRIATVVEWISEGKPHNWKYR